MLYYTILFCIVEFFFTILCYTILQGSARHNHSIYIHIYMYTCIYIYIYTHTRDLAAEFLDR